MSGRILTLDKSNHRALQDLLPWFVAGTLDEDERAAVQDHLRGCAQCQADADWQRKLQAAEPGSAAVPDLEHALERMMPRLSEQARPPRRNILSAFLRSLMPANANAMRWAMAAQMAVIVGLSALLLVPDRSEPAYRVLGSPRDAGGNIVVMFKPDVTEQDLRRILHASGARMVDGPTVTDAYLLAVDAAQQAEAVTRLRSESKVTLAEPLDAGDRR